MLHFSGNINMYDIEELFGFAASDYRVATKYWNTPKNTNEFQSFGKTIYFSILAFGNLLLVQANFVIKQIFNIILKREAKRMIIKQLFDRRFSAGEIFQQLKCLGFNGTFIYRTIFRLLDNK